MNIVAKLYCGQPGTGKSTLLRKLYAEYTTQQKHTSQRRENASQIILCPTNQLISTYQAMGCLNVATLYNLLKLTPKMMPSKHLKNFSPLYKDRIQIPRRIFIDEVFMFSYQEIWALLKCIQIKQTEQKTLPLEEAIEIYMFGDPFQLKCTATSITQQKNIKQGGDGSPVYWYHAFKDFNINIETEYLQKLYRFDTEFGKYISNLKQTWRNQITPQYNFLSQCEQNLPQCEQNPLVCDQNQSQYNQNLPQCNQNTHQKLPFDVISMEKDLKKYISQGYVILVGTHKARTYYQQHVFRQFKTSMIYAKDGKKYRLNGPVYTLSQTGQSYQKKYILSAYDPSSGDFTLTDEITGNTTILKPSYKNKISYQIAPGDVLTVNVVQGRELPGVIIDMQSLFEFGSFYTAISRCKKIQDVKLISVAQLQQPDLENEYVLSELLQTDEINV